MTLIKTNLWKGITVVSAFALALVLVFGSGSSNVKTANAAACTLDVATTWAAGDTNNTIACTVSAGVDQIITVNSEDLVTSHKMFNDNDPNAGLGDTINVKVDGLTTAGASGITPTGADTTVYLAKTVSVPADATLVISDTPIYLMEGDILKGGASAPSDLDLFISYEVLDDA